MTSTAAHAPTADLPGPPRPRLVASSVLDLRAECHGHPHGGDMLTRADRRAALEPLRHASRQLACALERHPPSATLPTTRDRDLIDDGWVTGALVDLLEAVELAYVLLSCSCQADSELPARLGEKCAAVEQAAQIHTAPDGHGSVRQALGEWLDHVVYTTHLLESGVGRGTTPQEAAAYLDGFIAGDGYAWWVWTMHHKQLPAELARPVGRLLARRLRASAGMDSPFVTAALADAIANAARPAISHA